MKKSLQEEVKKQNEIISALRYQHEQHALAEKLMFKKLELREGYSSVGDRKFHDEKIRTQIDQVGSER